MGGPSRDAVFRTDLHASKLAASALEPLSLWLLVSAWRLALCSLLEAMFDLLGFWKLLDFIAAVDSTDNWTSQVVSRWS